MMVIAIANAIVRYARAVDIRVDDHGPNVQANHPMFAVFLMTYHKFGWVVLGALASAASLLARARTAQAMAAEAAPMQWYLWAWTSALLRTCLDAC